MSKFTRRILGLASVCALTLGVVSQAMAQSADWPSRNIRIVVPYPPGTGPDVMARLVAEGLSKELKTGLIVENKPGANAILGTDVVAKAPADGYTFLLVDRLTLSVNPLLYPSMPFDPAKDIMSVSNIADVNLYLVVSSSLPITDYKSFIEYAKARPDEVTFGTGGNGSIMHLNMELLQSGTGSKFLHVPYKALAEVIPAMLGGQVVATSGGVEAVLPHVQSGKMKLLAVGSKSRTAIAPNVPTITEVGGSDMLLSTSYSFHARAGTSPDVVNKMQAALAKVLQSPEVQSFSTQRGLYPGASKPSELDKQIASDLDRVTKLIRERNIKIQ